MSRRKQAPKRKILPDPVFKSERIAKFMNVTMVDGKKSLAERIVYGALDHVVVKISENSALMKTLEESPREQRGRGRNDRDGHKGHRGRNDQEAAEGDEGSEGDSAADLKIGTVKGRITECSNARKLALLAFERALSKIMPTVEVKSRRVGGSTYQVPVEIRATRRQALAMRWLNEFSNKRGEKEMPIRLGNEILDALQGRGGAVKKRTDVHSMAKANEAFAHYRW